MTRTIRRPLAVMAAMLIAAMWFTSAAQAGAPQTSPIPAPRPQAQPAQPALMFCGARDEIIEKLLKLYGETRRGFGVAIGERSILEIWVSVTGTWTILETAWNGRACVMAVGDGWQDDRAAEKAAGEGV